MDAGYDQKSIYELIRKDYKAQAIIPLNHLVKTPAHDIIEILTEGGHIGTLMGNEALKTNWTQVNEMLQMVI
jgi:hypothetical protein